MNKLRGVRSRYLRWWWVHRGGAMEESLRLHTESRHARGGEFIEARTLALRNRSTRPSRCDAPRHV
jgi:hypothetical protein